MIGCLIYDISDATARVALARHEILPDEITLVRSAQKGERCRCRVLGNDGIHLTLRFLSETTEGSVEIVEVD